MKKLASGFVCLAAMAAMTVSATERMLVYDIDMVPDWKNSSNPAANVTKLTRLQDGVVNSGVDGGQPVINFGATYHITKIVYAGRPETGSSVNLRMRNAKFYSSMDGVTYTLFHTVPTDFAQDASSLTTNDLSSANVVGRYFKWTGIGYGSITESEFWTDTDAIRISATEIYGETASGATASVTVLLDGDFISKRRYKEGVYAIPYEGEEVKLYWANQDQYYIKTSENFKDYTFVFDGITVHFRLVDATTEQNNNKESKDTKRTFMLFTEDEENYPGIKTFEYDPDAAEIVIRFVYDVQTKYTGKADTIEKNGVKTTAQP